MAPGAQGDSDWTRCTGRTGETPGSSGDSDGPPRTSGTTQAVSSPPKAAGSPKEAPPSLEAPKAVPAKSTYEGEIWIALLEQVPPSLVSEKSPKAPVFQNANLLAPSLISVGKNI